MYVKITINQWSYVVHSVHLRVCRYVLYKMLLIIQPNTTGNSWVVITQTSGTHLTTTHFTSLTTSIFILNITCKSNILFPFLHMYLRYVGSEVEGFYITYLLLQPLGLNLWKGVHLPPVQPLWIHHSYKLIWSLLFSLPHQCTLSHNSNSYSKVLVICRRLMQSHISTVLYSWFFTWGF